MILLVWYLMLGTQTYLGGPYATLDACERARTAFERPSPSGLVLVCREHL